MGIFTELFGGKTREQIRAEQISRAMKARNVNKHLRIARATTGHEQKVHMERAIKLATRYGFQKG